MLPLPEGKASQKYCTLGMGASGPRVGMLVYITSPALTTTVRCVCCRACGAREAGTSSQETAGCAREAMLMQKLVSLCHEVT